MARKLKKFPKEPKGDNPKTFEAWKKKCDAVKKYNDGINSEKKKVLSLKEAVRKMKGR